jgi:2-hydroxychromene-2-carboxylate isomerase
MPKIDFWYDYSSSYSYLAASRIEPLAKAAGVAVQWRPFLLGPVFKVVGLNASPAEVFPIKGQDKLRAQTEEAVRLGMFGAPNFVTEDGEMFWGNDRLEQALEWATGAKSR